MYANFATIEDTVELLRYIAEDVSLRFSQWDDRYVRGPSLYFLVVSDVRIDSFVDPLGDNAWPVATARALPEDFTAAVAAAADIAFGRDGAVVISADGTFQEQMVRVRTIHDYTPRDAAHAEWMSAKHLSASEISTKEEVLAAVTLSEEDGRVTVFRDGAYDDYPREKLGGRWRAQDGLTPPDRTRQLGADR